MTHPAVHSKFVKGYFVVRRSDKVWCGIFQDLHVCIEQTLMGVAKGIAGLSCVFCIYTSVWKTEHMPWRCMSVCPSVSTYAFSGLFFNTLCHINLKLYIRNEIFFNWNFFNKSYLTGLYTLHSTHVVILLSLQCYTHVDTNTCVFLHIGTHIHTKVHGTSYSHPWRNALDKRWFIAKYWITKVFLPLSLN